MWYFVVRCCLVLLFVLVYQDQLVKAGEEGRAHDVIALLAEGANIERKNQVRDSFLILNACLSA